MAAMYRISDNMIENFTPYLYVPKPPTVTHYSNCKEPVGANEIANGRCHTCYYYRHRHGGAERPLEAVEKNLAAREKKERSRLAGLDTTSYRRRNGELPTNVSESSSQSSHIYRMSREIQTVVELMEGWSFGVNGDHAVHHLEQEYGQHDDHMGAFIRSRISGASKTTLDHKKRSFVSTAKSRENRIRVFARKLLECPDHGTHVSKMPILLRLRAQQLINVCIRTSALNFYSRTRNYIGLNIQLSILDVIHDLIRLDQLRGTF